MRNDAKLRLERRKGIVGNLRPCGRNDREQGGFSGVGNADDAAIGEQPQLEPQHEIFARFPALGETRRLTNAGCKVLIA